jgi:molybdate transport system regulatory protein
LGSLSAAAKAMKMSYRAAWGRIRASEERLGVDLLEKAPSGRGLVLTPAGEKLVHLYALFENRIDTACQEIGLDLFGREPGFGRTPDKGQDETD